MTRHTHPADPEIAGVTYEVTLSYDVTWGCAPSRDDPGAGDTIEDLTVETIDGRRRPWNVQGYTDNAIEALILEQLDGVIDDALISSAVEDEIGRREDAAEARYRSQREDMR